MHEQLLEQKLELVKTEVGQLFYQESEFITTGCEKDVLILDRKTVISFYRNGLQVDPYEVRQELIRRLRKYAVAVMPECL